MSNKDEFQEFAEMMSGKRNAQGIPDFEGYSPAEMHNILYNTFDPVSPIQLQKLSEVDYREIPLLNQVQYFLRLIAYKGELKLTKAGYLPRIVVTDLYSQGFMKDKFIEDGYQQLNKELDSVTVNLTRLLPKVIGLIKKRNGKLSLTKLGTKLYKDDDKLLRHLFTSFATRFNWGYFDYYSNEFIGQFGVGFSLILLKKYGTRKRLSTFYADKYFQALPNLNYVPNDRYMHKDSNSICYIRRTFERFLLYFGLVDFDEVYFEYSSKSYVKKTHLYNKFIQIRPHKTN